MGALLLKALFVIICVVAVAFFVFVIHGMLQQLKRPKKLD
jgi:hypothetical protein